MHIFPNLCPLERQREREGERERERGGERDVCDPTLFNEVDY
jgi:hypothetical protein